MNTNQDQFAELANVNTRCWAFWKEYIIHCFKYPLFFFKNAPIYKWWDVLGSTHRVAWDCARAKMVLSREPDVWNRWALRNKFIKWEDQFK